MLDTDDIDPCAAIIDSIEQRWKKADQEVFIAAVLLNPFFRSAPFAPLEVLNNAGIHALFDRLWRRFFRDSHPPADFHLHVSDYLRKEGFFTNLATQCTIVEGIARRNVCFLYLQSRRR